MDNEPQEVNMKVTSFYRQSKTRTVISLSRWVHWMQTTWYFDAAHRGTILVVARELARTLFGTRAVADAMRAQGFTLEETLEILVGRVL